MITVPSVLPVMVKSEPGDNPWIGPSEPRIRRLSVSNLDDISLVRRRDDLADLGVDSFSSPLHAPCTLFGRLPTFRSEAERGRTRGSFPHWDHLPMSIAR